MSRRSAAAPLLTLVDEPDRRYVGPKSTPEYQREYRKRNLEKSRAREAARRRTPKHRKYMRDWARKNRAKRSIGERRKLLSKRYGMTPEQYDQMVVQQGNRCAICGGPPNAPGNKKAKVARLAVDHCHATGKVRALLCCNCNAILGHAKDGVDVLRSAIAYLERFNA